MTFDAVGSDKRDPVYGGSERLHCNDKRTDYKQINVLGSRSLSYYNYRHSNSSGNNTGVSHNNSCNDNLPKNYKHSISRCPIQARIIYDDINNRSVLDSNNNNLSSITGNDGKGSAKSCMTYDNVRGRLEKDGEWDDDLEDTECSYSNVSEAVGSERIVVTISNHNFSDKVTDTGSLQLKREGDVDQAINDITHKIKGVFLGDDKKPYWIDFYKIRQTKRLFDNTKDGNHMTSDEKANFSNLGLLQNAQLNVKDTNSSSLRFDSRHSIGPSVFNTKDRIANDSSIEENIGHQSNGDITKHHSSFLEDKYYRNKLKTPVNIENRVENDVNLALRKNSKVGFNECLNRDSVPVVQIGEESNTQANVRKPNIIRLKLTAYYMSKYREIDKIALNKHKYDNCQFKDLPSNIGTNNYFFGNYNSGDLNNFTDKNNIKDKENVSDPVSNKNSCKSQGDPFNTKSYSINNDSHSNKILQDNNKVVKAYEASAQPSLKSTLLLRRLQIYEKINNNLTQ